MRLKGKRALVTAAGQGIGRACAEAFAAEGAEVFATDVDAGLLADFKGGETFALNALDAGSIAEGVARAKPDVVLNAAGFVHAGTILDATEDEWDFAFNLNVRSQFRVMRAAIPGMVERGGGSIVNIGSAAGVHVGAPNRAIYGATKAAIEGLAKATARDFITQGVRVNVICPGTVDTPSLHDRLRATGDYEKAMKDFIARQPMGRLAGPKEIANLAVYLGSDESAFVTGQAHLIDGGVVAVNAYDLKGRKAVVTGGAQGIGRAIAERFIESGATVTIWDMDRALSEAMCAETGASAVNPDLTSWDEVKSAAARTAAEMGGIDILVCNAGIAGMNTTVADYPVEEWRKVLSVNLDGVFHCCKAVSPLMAEAGYGRIVNVASIAGKEGNPNASAYSASKAGVIALTKSLGKELAEKNVAVNCITPAAAKTAIFDQMTEQHISYMLAKIPRGRFVKVEEIASLVSWLVSEENSFTTGGVFDISGGRATY